MSTLQVDRIIPYQSASVTVEGLSAPNLATTGSNTFVGNQNIQGTITASIQEGFALVGGAGSVSRLVATSSFGTQGNFATTGSNTFNGNQTISGSILQSGSLLNEFTKVQIAKSNKADFSEANTLLSLVGDTEVIFDQYVDGGNYDSVNIRIVQNSGSQFRDYDSTTNWVPWLTVPTNTGNNPSPIFTRGLKITGSLGVSGNTTINNGTQTITGASDFSRYSAGSFFVSGSSHRNLQGPRAITISKPSFNYPVFEYVYTSASSSLLYNFTDNLTATASYTLGVFDNGFTQDVELQIETTTTEGIKFYDIRSDTGVYTTFLKIAPNGGSNPPLEFKRSAEVTGSVNISQVLKLAPQNPLPANGVGQLAVSGSNLYYNNGSTWTQIN